MVEIHIILMRILSRKFKHAHVENRYKQETPCEHNT